MHKIKSKSEIEVLPPPPPDTATLPPRGRGGRFARWGLSRVLHRFRCDTKMSQQWNVPGAQ